MNHKFNEDDVVIHDFYCNEIKGKRQDRAKIVGYCISNPDDTEPRYGIELLDRKCKSTRYSGLSEVIVEYRIVKAVCESSLTLVESPKEEKSVAEVVSEIENPVIEPSGV